MAALGVDHNYWYLENLTSLCSPSCSKSLQTWLSQVESSCASDEINQSGILVQAKTVALQYTYYYSLACLQDSSGKWCFYESQNWVGSDYIRYDPDMCWQDPAPELCNDPDFSIDQIDAAMEAVPNLYNKTLYCSECFMKLWQQRLISPFLPVSNHTKFLMEQFEYMQGNCSKSMPYSTSPSTLFVSIAPTPTEVSNSTGSSITPTCTGQLASPEPTPIGCNQLADRYNVSTGDLRIATGDFFCEIHQTVCLPAPCSLAIIDSYGKTCDGYASQLSNSTLNVTSAMFFGWNQNIQGSCDDLSIDQRICIGPPGGSWVVNGSVYAPTGTSAYHTTAKPATPTQTGTIPDCGLYYEAVSGDTCQQICLRFGISFDQFRKLNTYINDNCTNLWLRYSVCIAEMAVELDYVRCATLHNRLLERGWVDSGKQLEYDTNDDQVEVLHRRNWFEFYGPDAERVRSRLSPSLVAFLERALVVDDHSLHYYVAGLSSPDYLWSSHERESNMGIDSDRYLTLYTATGVALEQEGLVFDQMENKAIMQMSIFDSPITHNGRQQWFALEVILSAWLDMVEVGKVQAVNPDIDVPSDKFDPWISLPYSDDQLQETLTVYHSLLDVIESRIPVTSRPSSTYPLIPDDSLAAANISDGFAWEFLSKARRPLFRYIAPGLEIPTSDTFRHQPFSSVESVPLQEVPDRASTVQFPILLFRASDMFYALPSPHGANDRTGSHLPFPWPWSQVNAYPAGLYLTDSDRETICFEDGARLVLPFGIGSRGYARTSDGARFGENKEEKGAVGQPHNTHADLYQLGYVPFIESHEVRLAQVLRAWLKQVESGAWEVGTDGVLGGIEKWREADTEAKWAGYVVPISW
ncbi:hypothetical protein GL218_07223 [Daldinia childiae]|uniref:uncharacterized protein n=1 Tax=Daldinia childiae TaxID=326645 RepID=UPI0014479465|nr:uncharacterized protein GL218_07223 [Daldinia childiae]KAF3055548.1 hypothetical protein GL218_07223 [Daldinia childiae]